MGGNDPAARTAQGGNWGPGQICLVRHGYSDTPSTRTLGCPCRLCLPPSWSASCHICPFPSSQLSSSRPGPLRLLSHHSPSVSHAALGRRPSPLYPGLTRTGLRLTECPEAWSASVGVWVPEGGKAHLNSREAGVGGVEASKTKRPWPIVTTGAMAIRSHVPAAQTKRSSQVPADPYCR